MLGIQVHYLQGFSFFWEWNIFVYSLLAFTVLTLMYLLARPKDTSSPLDDIRKKIEKQARETGHLAA
jgi:LMBR1 domain-containing protein 1